MPKQLDEKITEIGPYTIFRKYDSGQYEIVGPAVEHSPIGYTMIRLTPETLGKILNSIRLDAQKIK
jgi:hypothetical protein